MPRPRPGPPTNIKVLLVDNHPIVRKGLAALIDQVQGWVVTSEAGGPEDALNAIEKDVPDLAIVGIALGTGDGIDLVKRIRTHHPDVRVLVLSLYSEDLYAERVIRAGGHGYVMKHEDLKTIVAAAEHVLAGEIYLSPKMQSRIVSGMARSMPEARVAPVERLSDRELEVFKLIGSGRTNRQIAEHLDLSIKTVESHRSRIKSKLRVKSGTELAYRAVQWLESELRQ